MGSVQVGILCVMEGALSECSARESSQHNHPLLIAAEIHAAALKLAQEPTWAQRHLDSLHREVLPGSCEGTWWPQGCRPSLESAFLYLLLQRTVVTQQAWVLWGEPLTGGPVPGHGLILPTVCRAVNLRHEKKAQDSLVSFSNAFSQFHWHLAKGASEA